MEITRHIPIHFIFVLLLYANISHAGFGYDSANQCGPNGKISRRGRAQILAAIPCDLTLQPYCEKAGQAYPWHAVRRFVHENQGLMKRMYGDVLHIAVLRDEIQNNDIDVEDMEETAARYSREGQRRSSKFMHEPEDYTQKQNDLLKEPHFRPMSSNLPSTPKAAEATTALNAEDLTTTIDAVAETAEDKKPQSRNRPTEASRYRPYYNSRRRNRTTTTSTTTTTTTKAPDRVAIADPELETAVLEAIKLLKSDAQGQLLNDDDSNLHSNSVYELHQQTASDGANIQIIESPQLGVAQNHSVKLSTISSTLKLQTTMKPQHFYTRRRPSIAQQQQQAQQIYKISTNIKESAADAHAKVQLKESEGISTTSAQPSTAHMLVKGDNNNKNTTTTAATVLLATTEVTAEIATAFTNTTKTTMPTTATTTTTTTTTIAVMPSMLPLRVNGELLSSNSNNNINVKQRKPSTTATTTTTTSTFSSALPTTTAGSVTTASTKPVLRDGQLFQDTIKQESATPMLNLRGVNACPVKEEVVAPFWANNTRGEVLALLNMYPFEQYVHWEKCTHEHKQMYCRDGCRCEQQYRLHRLLAYDPHNECRGIFSDWFRFPSCCICKCYNIPIDFRATSRSPRAEHMETESEQQHPIERAEAQVKQAIYEHATEDWYRPLDDYAYEYDDN